MPIARLTAAWPHDPVQRDRALAGLVADGLVEPEDGTTTVSLRRDRP
jgi:hypothetical protein